MLFFCDLLRMPRRDKNDKTPSKTQSFFWPLEVALGLEIGARLFWFKQRSRLFVGSALADWLLAFHELP